jgi:2-phospho-L-lactate guanylyltransferase
MSSCWALTPVKELDAAKSRLAGVLTPGERRSLALALLERLATALSGCPVLSGWMVITRDSEVAAFARSRGATVVREAGTGLNAAVAQGCREAVRRGAESVLVLPSDLPLVGVDEITRIVQLGAGVARAVVVVPCVRREGTNALLLKPPGVIPPAFGPDSASRHLWLAAVSGAAGIYVPDSPLAYDVDRPEDLTSLPAWLAEKVPCR